MNISYFKILPTIARLVEARKGQSQESRLRLSWLLTLDLTSGPRGLFAPTVNPHEDQNTRESSVILEEVEYVTRLVSPRMTKEGKERLCRTSFLPEVGPNPSWS